MHSRPNIPIVSTLSLILLTNALAIAGLQATSGVSPAVTATYGELEQVVSRGRKNGFSDSDRENIKKLTSKLADGSTGTRLTLDRLEQMNRKELVPAVRAQDERSECTAAMTETAMQNAPLKFILFRVLAASYRRSDANVRHDILRALENSFTPIVACDTDGGRMVMSEALIRVGPDSIPVLLRLGADSRVTVRCGAAQLLNWTGEEYRSRTRSTPPGLSCDAPPNTRTGQIQRWQDWWRSQGSTAPWPTLADNE